MLGKERKLHLLQLAKVSVGDAVIPANRPSLKKRGELFFCSLLNHLSWAAHPAARLYLIQAFLQRHLNIK